MSQANAMIVVPCYNEGLRLPKEQYREFAKRANDYKFLFVDDGSQDNTYDILDSLCREHPNQFEILKLERNSGKAEAVRHGFLRAMRSEAKFLAYWDADLATPLDALPLFLDVFKERPGTEIVFGSRIKLLGHDIRRNELRHYLGRVFATCASLVLNLGVYDTQCGAKMFRKTETLGEMFKDPFRSKWIFDVELIARFINLKKKAGHSSIDSTIYELPLLAWYDVAGSKLKPTDFLKALGELVQIYRVYRLGG